MNIYMKINADFISVLYDILILWLKILFFLVLVSCSALFIAQILPQSWHIISFLKNYFGNFLVITITSSVVFMPYLLFLAYFYKEEILNNKLDSLRAKFIGAGFGFAYGLIISFYTRDNNFPTMIFPFFGGLVGYLLAHFIFSKFEKKYLFHKKEEKSRIFIQLYHVILAFLKAIFFTLLISSLISLYSSLTEGGTSLGDIIFGAGIYLLVFVAGSGFGCVIAFPCIILAYYVYKWLIQENHKGALMWVIASFMIGLTYFIILQLIFGEVLTVVITKNFFIPVSCLTGYLSWCAAQKTKIKEER